MSCIIHLVGFLTHTVERRLLDLEMTGLHAAVSTSHLLRLMFSRFIVFLFSFCVLPVIYPFNVHCYNSLNFYWTLPGDSKDAVREKAQTLLSSMMDNVLAPNNMFERLIPAFSHKNGKVREEVMTCLQNTLTKWVCASASYMAEGLPCFVFLVSWLILFHGNWSMSWGCMLRVRGNMFKGIMRELCEKRDFNKCTM